MVKVVKVVKESIGVAVELLYPGDGESNEV